MTGYSQQHDNYVNFRLRAARDNKHYSQAELARRLGLTRTAVYGYELLTRMPSPARQEQIAQTLDCTIQDIFPSILPDIVRTVRRERNQKRAQTPPRYTSSTAITTNYFSPQQGAESVPEQAMRAELWHDLRAAVQRLPPKERTAITELSGLTEDGTPRSFADVSERMGVYPRYSRVLRRSALRKLRQDTRLQWHMRRDTLVS